MTDNDDDDAIFAGAFGDRVRTRLVRAVEDASGVPWDLARRRWSVAGVSQVDGDGVCVCGQHGLVWLYTIIDGVNDAVLEPIGSSCIEHFGVAGMTDGAARLRAVAEMAEVVRAGGHLVLRGPGRNVSAAKLLALLDEGAFRPSRWNRGYPASDYDFLLRMLRSHFDPSPRQDAKIGALLREAETFLRACVGREILRIGDAS